MLEWWNSLDFLSQALYCIAIPTSLILLVQIVLTIVGFGQGGPGVNPDDLSGLDGGIDVLDVDISASMDANMDTNLDTGDFGSTPGDIGALHLFTLEGVMAFLAVFSWTAIIGHRSGLPDALAVLLGAAFGALALYGVAKILQLTVRLSSNGILRIRNALGQQATVYLPIPANGAGQGKVTLTIQERFIEAAAITDGPVDLASGTLVRVVDVRADDILVVERE